MVSASAETATDRYHEKGGKEQQHEGIQGTDAHRLWCPGIREGITDCHAEGKPDACGSHYSGKECAYQLQGGNACHCIGRRSTEIKKWGIVKREAPIGVERKVGDIANGREQGSKKEVSMPHKAQGTAPTPLSDKKEEKGKEREIACHGEVKQKAMPKDGKAVCCRCSVKHGAERQHENNLG